MKILFYVISGILVLSTSYGKTLLISDIDDTIKNSHVLDRSDSLFNAGKYDNLVLGMNQTYHAVKALDPAVKIFYVSNAPKSVMEKSHRKFLSFNKFPAGSLHLRGSFFQNDFKLVEIRKILKSQKPDSVVLIGDNGERDISIYEQIKKEHPQIRFLTYIHLAYSRLSSEYQGAVMAAGQKGFVTSLDLFLLLRKEGLVADEATDSFVDYFTRAFAQEMDMFEDGVVAIPRWLDCRDFTWTAPDSDLTSLPFYLDAKNRILERCQIAADED